MSREENGCSDLTSAIPYSWRLSERTPLFKDFSIAFLHKYMLILLPNFITHFWVAVRVKAKLKILALVSQYSEKPKVRYVSDFNLGSLT